MPLSLWEELDLRLIVNFKKFSQRASPLGCFPESLSSGLFYICYNLFAHMSMGFVAVPFMSHAPTAFSTSTLSYTKQRQGPLPWSFRHPPGRLEQTYTVFHSLLFKVGEVGTNWTTPTLGVRKAIVSKHITKLSYHMNIAFTWFHVALVTLNLCFPELLRSWFRELLVWFLFIYLFIWFVLCFCRGIRVECPSLPFC